MKERPILFSGEMVRAILDGRKTQTRRVMKMTDRAREAISGLCPERLSPGYYRWALPTEGFNAWSPYGYPDDRLWVREAFALHRIHDGSRPSRVQPTLLGAVAYSADAPGAPPDGFGRRWRPSIHMPRWASRITLRVTDVRVQRVQDISDEDAYAEGISPMLGAFGFSVLWDRINGARAPWSANPWVWAVSFERVQP